MKTIGQKIAEKRKQMHLTQEELAFKLNVSPQAVSKWQNDLSIPDVTLLIALSDLFNISLDELIREKQNLPVTTLVEQENKKPLEKMLLKIIVNSKDGDKVKVNLPVQLIKLGINISKCMPEINGNDALKDIDFDQIFNMIENGVIGKIVEVESSDGDIVEIYVE